MGSSSVEMKVLTIGAGKSLVKRQVLVTNRNTGSAGLLIVQGLKKHGIPFEIFERDAGPDARSRDWSLIIHWASENLQACLEPEYFSRLVDIQCDPYYGKEVGDFEPFPYKNGETGESMMTIPLAKSHRATQKKLKAFLREGQSVHKKLERSRVNDSGLRTGLDVQFNKKIARISTTADEVTAIFDDGSTSHGTHIIGADGAKSSMRTLICGAEKAGLTPMDITLCNFRTKYTAEQSRYLKYGKDSHPLLNICIHERHKIAIMTVPMDMCDLNDPSYWAGFHEHSWQRPRNVD